MHASTLSGSREIPCLSVREEVQTASESLRTYPMMHGHGKSDSSIVPEKPPNEAVPEAKEVVEGRDWPRERRPSVTGPGLRRGAHVQRA